MRPSRCKGALSLQEVLPILHDSIWRSRTLADRNGEKKALSIGRSVGSINGGEVGTQTPCRIKASYVGKAGEAPATTERIREGLFVLLGRILKWNVE